MQDPQVLLEQQVQPGLLELLGQQALQDSLVLLVQQELRA